ncbi:hypothetical protein LINGRAHAP2_LOCUS23245 [Linum grandiflorum]
MKWYMDEDGFPVAIDLSPGAKDTTKPYFPIREPPLEGGQDALPWRIESQSPQLTRSLFRNTKSHQISIAIGWVLAAGDLLICCYASGGRWGRYKDAISSPQDGRGGYSKE